MLEAIGEGFAGVRSRWQSNGVSMTGATNASYAITDLSTGGRTVYQVIIPIDAGSVTNTTTLVTHAPVFTAQTPEYDLWVTNGGTLTFGASVTDNFPSAWPLSCQWQVRGRQPEPRNLEQLGPPHRPAHGRGEPHPERNEFVGHEHPGVGRAVDPARQRGRVGE
jgi:hypothetical protein